MTTHVERSIEVDVPVRTAYDQWTQFEDFPRFMGGVQQVRQVGETLTHWVAEIAGVRREWDAEILEQVPDQKVAWAATTGATNAGTVYFDAVGENTTRVRLTLDYEPEGIVEKIGDWLDVVDRQAVADLDRFKSFIESRGHQTGGWRGDVDDTGAPLVGADAAAAGGVPPADVAAAGVQGGTTGRASAVADDPAGQVDTTNDAGVPGDVVAVGPTGDTRGTLDTEPGEGRSSAPAVDQDALGHSGDPVAVDPGARSAGPTVVDAQSTGHGDADRTGTAAGAGVGAAGVAGFGTDTGLGSDDPASGAFTGNPGAGSTGTGRPGGGEADRTGTAAGAATGGTGVAGFGTDTGLSSDDPASGAFTGDPGGRSASHTGVGDLVGEVHGRHEAWTDDAGSRSATTGTDEPFTAGASGPGERTTAGERVVQRDFADENLTTDDVVARDFADRDVTGEGTVQRDFANRDITEGDIANRGVNTGMGGAHVTPQPTGLDAADAPGPADGIGAKLDPLDPRAGTADDPDNPARPSV